MLAIAARTTDGLGPFLSLLGKEGVEGARDVAYLSDAEHASVRRRAGNFTVAGGAEQLARAAFAVVGGDDHEAELEHAVALDETGRERRVDRGAGLYACLAALYRSRHERRGEAR